MLKLPVHILQPGMVLAQAITDDRGRTLLRDGIALTDEYIEVLKQRGLSNAHVVTESDDSVGFDDRIPLAALHLAQTQVGQVFEFVRSLAEEVSQQETPSPPSEMIADEAVTAAIRSTPTLIPWKNL
jgi:hypothetical protein